MDNIAKDLESLDRFLEGERGAARPAGAILVEPILGRGGQQTPPVGWLPGLRELADRHEAVLIFDEIYTGLGRTGTWWAGDAEGVVPDVVLAPCLLSTKALGWTRCRCCPA